MALLHNSVFELFNKRKPKAAENTGSLSRRTMADMLFPVDDKPTLPQAAALPMKQTPVVSSKAAPQMELAASPKLADTVQKQRFIAPKGMSFNEAFKMARSLKQSEFDYYDPKIGRYRPIAVVLAPKAKAAPAQATPKASPAQTVPAQNGTYNRGNNSTPMVAPEMYDDESYVAGTRDNYRFPEQDGRLGDYVVDVQRRLRKNMGITDLAETYDPNRKKVPVKKKAAYKRSNTNFTRWFLD